MIENQSQIVPEARFAAEWQNHALHHVLPLSSLTNAIIEKQVRLRPSDGTEVSEITAFCKILSDAGIEARDRAKLVGLRYGVLFPPSLV